jgi:hypothetical protein
MEQKPKSAPPKFISKELPNQKESNPPMKGPIHKELAHARQRWIFDHEMTILLKKKKKEQRCNPPFSPLDQF